MATRRSTATGGGVKRGATKVNNLLKEVVKIESSSESSDEEDDEVWSKAENVSSSSSSDDSEVEEEPRKRGSKKRRLSKGADEDVDEDTEVSTMTVAGKKLNFDKLTVKILPFQSSRRNPTTLAEKLRILERIKSGETQSSIASSLKLSKSTIQHIWSVRDRYEEAAKDMSTDMKKCRKPTSVELEKLITSWVEHMKKEGTPVNGTQIREHAKVLAKGLGIDNFNASTGWLSRFRMRNNVTVPKMRKFLPNGMPKPDTGADAVKMPKTKNTKGRKVVRGLVTREDEGEDWNHFDDTWAGDDVDEPDADEQLSKVGGAPSNSKPATRKPSNKWITESWSRLSDGYSPQDIFFLGEFGLFYRTAPENYKDIQGLSCFDGEMAIERLSVLLGVNFVGTEKLKLAVVGSSPYPSSFGKDWNQTEQERLPTDYWFHPKSFITSEIISSCLRRWNTQLEKCGGRKVILLMGNSRAHQTVQTACSSLSQINIVVLPMSLGISSVGHVETGIGLELKTSYKMLLLHKLTRKREVRDERKKISILEACSLLHTAWQNLEETVITEVFVKSGLLKKKPEEQKKLPGRRKLETQLNVKTVMHRARLAGLRFPRELSFKAFVDIDENLICVDASTEVIDGRIVTTEDDASPCVEPPSVGALLNSLDDLRNYVVATSDKTQTNLKEFHDAVSFLQNLCVHQIPPEPPFSPPVITPPSQAIPSIAPPPLLKAKTASRPTRKSATIIPIGLLELPVSAQSNQSTTSSTYPSDTPITTSQPIQMSHAPSSYNLTNSNLIASSSYHQPNHVNYIITPNSQFQGLAANILHIQANQHQTQPQTQSQYYVNHN